jgi:glycosyltransferase involved in cell wall biosynthesis
MWPSMRILAIGNMYPPHSIGGYEVTWRSSTQHLRRRGHQVRVLTTDFRLPQAEGAEEDHDVHRELRWYWRDYDFPRLSLPAVMRLEAHNGRVMTRHTTEFGPEAVAWWAMGGMSLSLIERVKRDGVPSVAVVGEDWPTYGPEVDAWHHLRLHHARVGSTLGRLVGLPHLLDLDRSCHWLFNSAFTLGSVRANSGLPLAGAEVAHPGVDPALFRPRPPEPWRGRLLYVGRVEPRKGVDTAVEALRHLDPPTALRVVGSEAPGYGGQLRAQADGAGLDGRVELAEPRPREDLPAVYGWADALLFPVRWEEFWGLVPLEAMASGIPVVATGTGGSAEYMRDGENCLLFPPDDDRALAAAVRRLAEDPGLRDRLRAGGLDTAARFTEADYNDRIEGALVRARA